MSEQGDGAGEPRIPRSRLSDYAEMAGRPAVLKELGMVGAAGAG
ncbi:hypothetical protein ACWCQW_16005 [Streptomyces mirabilis]